jgi:hypothetical protein
VEDEVEETGPTKREDYETVDYMKEIYIGVSCGSSTRLASCSGFTVKNLLNRG